MIKSVLYPLRFEPIYQYRLWGGRRLADWLKAPLPSDGPIGEAWLLSDRDEHPSRVAAGPLKGHTIAQLMEQSPKLILGKLARRFRRFPLLLKFLDVQKMLSVQVHSPDGRADLIPKGETGKTEAWVILEAEPASRVYAGLKPGTTAEDLRALSEHTANKYLAGFPPQRGQGILIEAGVVHSLGDGVVVFEVQENSDVTFRLYDWNHIDPKTGHPRALQVAKALACIDLMQGPVYPIAPVVETVQPAMRERLFDGPHFRLWRLRGEAPFAVGAADEPRVLLCVEGAGNLEHDGADFTMDKGAVVLLPAVVGACRFRPVGPVILLDIAVPEQPLKTLVIFDLDGTLAESKASLDAEMATLLARLLEVVKVAVISGGAWAQFEKQVLSSLPQDERLKNLSLLPTCGTKFYRYDGAWQKLYSEDFSAEEKGRIIRGLNKAIDQSGLRAVKRWGDLIEDRGSQITFSGLGQEAPLDEKKTWDSDFKKRKKIKAILQPLIPEFSIQLGGATSIDVTKPGIDKGYG